MDSSLKSTLIQVSGRQHSPESLIYVLMTKGRHQYELDLVQLGETQKTFLNNRLFLDAIASPSTYPGHWVSESVSESVMFSDFGDCYHIYRACELVFYRNYFSQKYKTN